LIDIAVDKIDQLKDLLDDRENVHLYNGDCNIILMNTIFPIIEKDATYRALCLFDPYGLHYKWTVLERAGKTKRVDMFLNFPVMDINRNVLWRNPEGVSLSQKQRMTDSWGDDSWKEVAYSKKPPDIFNYREVEKESNETVVAAFRKRLQEIAEFQFVPEPIPMRNNQGATIYYLFFASQKEVAKKIVEDIYNKYRNRNA